jgi:hypothetical protein
MAMVEVEVEVDMEMEVEGEVVWKWKCKRMGLGIGTWEIGELGTYSRVEAAGSVSSDWCPSAGSSGKGSLSNSSGEHCCDRNCSNS